MIRRNVSRHWRTRTILLAVIFMSGCAPVYFPGSHHVPLLSKKGDFNGSITYALPRIPLPSGEVELRVSSAITNHLAVMTGYHFSIDRTLRDSAHATYWNHVHNFWEAGGGYYEDIDKQTAVQVFGGVGVGNAKTIDSDYSYHENIKSKYVEGQYVRVFVQPMVSLTAPSDNYRKLVLSCRASWVDVKHYVAYKRDFLNPKPIVFIEPSFSYITSVVPDHLFLNLQGSLSIPSDGFKGPYDVAGLMVSCGLYYRFSFAHRLEN